MPGGYHSESRKALAEKHWWDQYETLKAYKATNGSTIVPKRSGPTKSLAIWVDTQRSYNRKGKLREDRKQLLDQIGFVWKPGMGSRNQPRDEFTGDEQWLAAFEALKAYKTANGHTLVPSGFGDDTYLANWVFTQRINYKKGKLREDRKALLEQIGFAWEAVGQQRIARDGGKGDQQWVHMYEKLLAYKTTTGHTRVSRKADKPLGIWVETQRSYLKQGRLRGDRKEMLDQIGFVWSSVPEGSNARDIKKARERAAMFGDKWLYQYEKLKAFKATNGHTLVPAGYSADNSLANWVDTQRSYYKKGKLCYDRKELLDKIGFVLEPTKYGDTQWLEQYKKLVAYKAENGHTVVPKGYSADRSLAVWVDTQRVRNRKGMLRDDRKGKLDEIGFVWNVTPEDKR